MSIGRVNDNDNSAHEAYIRSVDSEPVGGFTASDAPLADPGDNSIHVAITCEAELEEEGYVQIPFVTLEVITKKEMSTSHGALLLALQTEQGIVGVENVWIPKYLCSNLNETENSVWVRANFIREHTDKFGAIADLV